MTTLKGLLCATLLLALWGVCSLHAQESTRRGFPARLDVQRDAPVLFRTSVTDPLPGGTYTVGTGGNFAGIDSAFDRLNGGGILGPVTLMLTDTLYVASAPARNRMFSLVGPIAGTGPSSRITIRPANNVAVTIRGSGPSTLRLLNASYISIDGTSLQGSTRLTVHASYDAQGTGWNDAVQILGNSDFNVVQNVTSRSDDARGSSGVVVASTSAGGPDSCLISGMFVPSAGVGVWVSAYDWFTPGGSLTAFRPKGNIVRKSRFGSAGDHLMGWGIYSEWTDDILIEQNEIDSVKGQYFWGIDTYPTTIGISALSCRNAVIRKNVVHTLTGSGNTRIWGIMGYAVYTPGAGLQIYNNMIYDIRNKSTDAPANTIGIALMKDNQDVLIANNSVFLDDTSATPDGTSALRLGQNISGVTIENNLFVNMGRQNTSTITGASDALRFNAGLAAISASDHNDLFVGPYSNSYVVSSGGTTYKQLADWQSAGRDTHSVSMLPVFVAPYLHLDSMHTTTEYLMNKGIPIAGVVDDFDGQLRDVSTPDIGADEIVEVKSTGGIIWTKDPRNPVLSGGGGTGYSLAMNPFVIYNADSARFEMWFNRAASSSAARPWLVGYATSPDGISWTQRTSAVLSPTPGTWDANTTEMPMVIRENGIYKMWYSSFLNMNSPGYIGYATSPDGINWTKYAGNPIFGRGTAAWEAGGPYSCSVMPVPGGYKIWYDAYDASATTSRIGYATSVDGIVWQRDTVHNPILPLGVGGAWDDNDAAVPRVLKIRIVNSSDMYFMWYSGSRGVSPVMSGLALSPDGITGWAKSPHNPVLSPDPGAWDGTDVGIGSVMLYKDILHAWYDGGTKPASTNLWHIGHATSRTPVTDVFETTQRVPAAFALEQNYPNPFNPSTTIRFQLQAAGDVRLAVYDLLGREVAVLVNERKSPGSYQVKFVAAGQSSGVYFYRLTTGNFVQTHKMLLVR